MPVVGTAGHVDHGKSTLTLVLSGRDPDRWAEEKRRGLTIDLGFAWTDLDGVDVSFVDVPGHERYSKNMLAGIESIDVALLVVAADEGWMPQSEEHLAVLDLLEVGTAVVALSKTDRVDADLVELATLEIEERLTGTTLAGSPIVPVSAITGEGVDRLRHALRASVAAVAPLDVGRPRLWVDRSFSVPGAGTVVTGTLLGGSVANDDRMVVHPGETECRIRGIQSHETTLDRVEPQRRVALNLGGVSASDIERGAMLGRAGHWRPTDRLAVSLRTARYVEQLSNRGAYHLHVGSGGWPVRVRIIDDGIAVLDLPTPLPLAVGDRFILRDTGRRMVVAGGRVLDPAPPRVAKLRAALPLLLGALDSTPDARAFALLEARGRDSSANVAADSGGGRPAGAVTAGSSVMTMSVASGLVTALERLVVGYHSQNPLRRGMQSAEAASRLGVDTETLTALIERSSSLTIDGSVVRSREFAGVRSDGQEQAWQRTRRRLEEAGPAAAPRIEDLEIGLELVHALAREGELVRISDEFVFLPAQVAELVEVIGSFAEPFTVSQFRERSGLSRKYAVPFLEWADRAGHTVRQGDARRPR